MIDNVFMAMLLSHSFFRKVKVTKIDNIYLKFSKLMILTIIAVFGILLLGITYYLAYNGKFYNSLFWMSILSFGIPIFLIISKKYVSQNYRIFFLFLLGIILYITHILPSTTHFQFVDELLHFETTKLIDESGSLDVATHFEISKYYPALELLTVFLKQITNIEIFPTSKILIGLIQSGELIFLYFFFKEITLSERLAAVGTFIYTTNPQYIFFHATFSYESLGVFLIIILLYIISKRSFEYLIAPRILTIVVISALVITHHLSSYMFIIFIIVLILIQIFKNIRQNIHFIKSYSNLIFFSVVLTISWQIYIATAAIKYLQVTFFSRFIKIFELALFGGEKSNIFSTSLSNSFLPSYEFIIDTYIYGPLLVLLSLCGIYFIKKEHTANIYIYMLIICGPILFILSSALISTTGKELGLRFWGFAFLGLSLIVSVALEKLMINDLKNDFLKILLLLIVILIFAGGISIGDKPVYREPDLLSPKILTNAGSITTDVVNAAEWFESKYGTHNRISSNKVVGNIFTSYGMQDVERNYAWKVFFPKSINDEVLFYIKIFRIDYVIVDYRISRLLSESGSYFGQKDNYIDYYPMYGYSEPLPKESLDKFHNSNLFKKTYDNGVLYIYKVDRRRL